MLRWTNLGFSVVVGILGNNGYLAGAAGEKTRGEKGETPVQNGTPLFSQK